MTPKWIAEILDMVRGKISLESLGEIEEKLLSIDTLLSISASETDNDFLHDDIIEEIRYEKA